MNVLITILKDIGVSYKVGIKLSKFSYMKTGGNADIIIYPDSSKKLTDVIKILNRKSIKYKIIGATSNLLFKDNEDYSCLLCLTKMSSLCLDIKKNIFIVESGVMLPEFARFALLKSSSGFEGLEGIPGTVGGAVFMNAGAYGSEIKDTLLKVDIITTDGDEVQLKASELNLSRRNSIFRTGENKGIIVRNYFKFEKGISEKIESKMELYHYKRHKYQDFLYPSLGSMFSGSLYRHLGFNDNYFKIISFLYYIFNYKLKIHRRESPMNRKWINDIVVKRFGLKYDIQPFSDKTINCLVNRGQGTDEMIRYINEMSELTDFKIPVENEIVENF